MTDHPIAGIELGGTKCVATLATADGDIRDQATVPTTGPDETLGAIEDVLARNHGVIAQAAAELGLSRQALYRRMDRHGIPRE